MAFHVESIHVAAQLRNVRVWNAPELFRPSGMASPNVAAMVSILCFPSMNISLLSLTWTKNDKPTEGEPPLHSDAFPLPLPSFCSLSPSSSYDLLGHHILLSLLFQLLLLLLALPLLELPLLLELPEIDTTRPPNSTIFGQQHGQMGPMWPALDEFGPIWEHIGKLSADAGGRRPEFAPHMLP